MIIAIYITLGIAILGWILSIILAAAGHCKIDWAGGEQWESEKCEWIYYYITAPISFISMLVSIILCCLTPFV